MTDDFGDQFQRRSKYRRGRLPCGGLDWASRPDAYKQYADRRRLSLPSPRFDGGLPLWTAMAGRRSVREFSDQALTLAEVSQLLWACQGITDRGRGREFRSTPSAGALYPVETYAAVSAVEGIPSGVYHYWVPGHGLELIREGDFREEASRSALDQDMAYYAPLVLIWTGIFERCKWKYGQRAYRYVYLDAGHIAQNLALAAVGLGLGSCQIGALYDDEVNALLGVDGDRESVLYMSVVGKPARGG